MKAIRPLLIVLVVGIMCWVGMLLEEKTDPPKPALSPRAGVSSSGVQAAEGAPKPDRVLVTVNGEAIRESDVALKLSKGSFDIQEDEARRRRLNRMVKSLSVRQYLAKEKIQIPEAEIDGEIQWLRQNPPSSGCICCRYQSLEQFMAANYYDMKELRETIANNAGLKKLLENLFEREHPPGDILNDHLARERSRIERKYIKVSHIFFNVFQNPLMNESPERARAQGHEKAQEAWQRLKKGESFEAVARDVSEDAVSREKGGKLECIPMETFGAEVEEIMRRLKPGDCSDPVESPWGYHIIRRGTLDDKDLLDLLKREFADRKQSEVLQNVWSSAKVEYPLQ